MKSFLAESKAKELISVPMDVSHTVNDLTLSLENSLYQSRALMHARRLLSLYLLTQTNQSGSFHLKFIILKLSQKLKYN